MMPVIRISDATWDRLKGYARPLEDTPEDVIRLALDALDSSRGKARTSAVPTVGKKRPEAAPTTQGSKLPQKEFRGPLLEVLIESGGRSLVRNIRARLESKVSSRLSAADYEKVSTGEPRWWNAVCWERSVLVKEGILRDDSPRGEWELSIQGHQLMSDASSSADTSPETWRDDVESALDQLDHGYGAPLSKIYDVVRGIRKSGGRSLPTSLDATIRRTLEDNSTDSDNFRGEDIFYMPEGKGAGIWGLRRKQKP